MTLSLLLHHTPGPSPSRNRALIRLVVGGGGWERGKGGHGYRPLGFAPAPIAVSWPKSRGDTT